eukprot:8352989-Pyramimonas_sp.AAC.1
MCIRDRPLLSIWEAAVPNARSDTAMAANKKRYRPPKRRASPTRVSSPRARSTMTTSSTSPPSTIHSIVYADTVLHAPCSSYPW